jgi:hypothetical protein
MSSKLYHKGPPANKKRRFIGRFGARSDVAPNGLLMSELSPQFRRNPAASGEQRLRLGEAPVRLLFLSNLFKASCKQIEGERIVRTGTEALDEIAAGALHSGSALKTHG